MIPFERGLSVQDGRRQWEGLPLQLEVEVPADDDGPSSGPVGRSRAWQGVDAADELPSRDSCPVTVGNVAVLTSDGVRDASPGGSDHVLPEEDVPWPELLVQLPALVGFHQDDAGEVHGGVQGQRAVQCEAEVVQNPPHAPELC